MFVDGRTLTDATTLEADVCIAGAGAAGMTIAMDLRASGLSVILLESGGVQRDAETQELSVGRMVGIDTWNLRSMRIRALGGTTGHWAGWCRPLMPQDFEPRDYIPNSGWPDPIRRDGPVVPARMRDTATWPVRMECERPRESDRRARCSRLARPWISAITSSARRPALRERTAAYLEKAEDVRVVLHANVTDIRLESEGARVSSLKCRTLTGTTFHVHANRYVLALGGIENARVLLASRSQQPAGVANGHDVVGRYFMEHPHYYDSVGLVRPAKLDLVFYTRIPSDLKRADGTSVRAMGALGLAADVARREKLLNFSVQFQPVSAKSDAGPLSRAMVQRLLDSGPRRVPGGRVSVRAEQSPIAESRVTLTDQVDAIGNAARRAGLAHRTGR